MRKVPTASGATAVQIVDKSGGQYRIVEHLGSAHSPGELAALMQVGREKLHPGQEELDLGLDPTVRGGAVVQSQSSRLLVEVIQNAWEALGFDVIADEGFFQLVLARLVEPTSMVDSRRVLEELGVTPVHYSTFKRALTRAGERDYRGQIATACFNHSLVTSGLSLLLYDVTTLYFEAEKEDDYRKVGFSKERRVDPQIVVGLLVDRAGFPLEIHCFAGNKPETQTILPVVQAFADRNNVVDMVVVADAGMLSATNLDAIEEAGLRFIVGSRMTKAPQDLAGHFHWHGSDATDGQIVDTTTLKRGKPRPDPEGRVPLTQPVWDPNNAAHARSWRTVWQHRHKRAVRDRHTLQKQRERAETIISGERPGKAARFVKTTGTKRVFDQATFERALLLAGWKGYITNIPKTVMDAQEVVASYHELWHVEQSFRMSKTDLQARPIFHRERDAVEAHLTVVFTALAINRYLYAATGTTLKKLVQTLRPLRDVTIEISGQQITATPKISAQTQKLLNNLKTNTGN